MNSEKASEHGAADIRWRGPTVRPRIGHKQFVYVVRYKLDGQNIEFPETNKKAALSDIALARRIKGRGIKLATYEFTEERSAWPTVALRRQPIPHGFRGHGHPL